MIGAPGELGGRGRTYVVLDLASWLEPGIEQVLDLAEPSDRRRGVVVVHGWGASGSAVAAAPLLGPETGLAASLVIGAPEGRCRFGEEGHGCAYVLQLSAEQLQAAADPGATAEWSLPQGQPLEAPDGTILLAISGPEQGSRFGDALAVGDPEGSGQLNLVVGAPGATFDADPPGPAASRVYVVADARGIQAFDGCLKTPPQPGEEACVQVRSTHDDMVSFLWGTFVAGDAHEQAGASVAAGDVDGDGLDDLVIGAPGWRTEGMEPDALGRVHVAYGRRSAPTDATRDLLDPPGLVPELGAHDLGVSHFPETSCADPWSGPLDHHTGTGVAVGDMNGDGFADLLVGSPGAGRWDGHIQQECNEAAGLAHVRLGGHDLRGYLGEDAYATELPGGEGCDPAGSLCSDLRVCGDANVCRDCWGEFDCDAASGGTRPVCSSTGQCVAPDARASLPSWLVESGEANLGLGGIVHLADADGDDLTDLWLGVGGNIVLVQGDLAP